jgi:hypothetical protein
MSFVNHTYISSWMCTILHFCDLREPGGGYTRPASYIRPAKNNFFSFQGAFLSQFARETQIMTQCDSRTKIVAHHCPRTSPWTPCKSHGPPVKNLYIDHRFLIDGPRAPKGSVEGVKGVQKWSA